LLSGDIFNDRHSENKGDQGRQEKIMCGYKKLIISPEKLHKKVVTILGP
jgi:hypothetical protein